MFVFSWFLLCFCCAGWRLCWRLLTPGVPVSRYGPVLGTLHPGAWSQPGCYPGHINLPSIYSVRPASQGHGSYTGGKLIPDPQFHDHGSMCYLQSLQDSRHNLEKRRDLAGRIYLHFGKLCGPHLWCLVLINVQIFYSQSFVKISHYST